MLSNEEANALQRYKSFEAYIINEKLRNGEKLTPNEAALVKDLDSALSKLPKHVGEVIRLLGETWADSLSVLESRLLAQNSIDFPEFISASYGGEYAIDNIRIRMHIRSKTGRDLHAAGFINDEAKEVLFARNTPFRILKRWYDEDALNVEMEES